MTAVQLGTTDLHLSPIGLGTAQFAGKSWISAMTPPIPLQHVAEVVKTALDGGITWFDSSEMYGGGNAERALARALIEAGVTPGDVVVATKWMPIGRTAASIERTIGERIQALDPFPIDLHQVHLNRGSLSSVRAQMRAMARLVQAGKIRAVGVSNFTTAQMQTAHDELARHGIPLASNEIQVNMLRRDIETNGMLVAAELLGISLLAYSAQAQGILTGKYHADRSLIANVHPVRRRIMGLNEKGLDRTKPLIDAMTDIATDHQATVGQIALAWLVDYYRGTVIPIAGASKAHHARDSAGALQVHLSDEETRHLDELSDRLRQ
ncbi:MAG: aldo/keto reductase [Mycolicibacterium cosmeticum]|nr:aldo/keto reductase [Mycolicibacterium cosmeticum]